MIKYLVVNSIAFAICIRFLFIVPENLSFIKRRIMGLEHFDKKGIMIGLGFAQSHIEVLATILLVCFILQSVLFSLFLRKLKREQKSPSS